jgi:hypothetical protein
MDDDLHRAFQEAIDGALAAAGLERQAVVTEWLTIACYSMLDGDDTAHATVILDSLLTTHQFAGLVAMLDAYRDYRVESTLFGGDEDDDGECGE